MVYDIDNCEKEKKNVVIILKNQSKNVIISVVLSNHPVGWQNHEFVLLYARACQLQYMVSYKPVGLISLRATDVSFKVGQIKGD